MNAISQRPPLPLFDRIFRSAAFILCVLIVDAIFVSAMYPLVKFLLQRQGTPEYDAICLAAQTPNFTIPLVLAANAILTVYGVIKHLGLPSARRFPARPSAQTSAEQASVHPASL